VRCARLRKKFCSEGNVGVAIVRAYAIARRTPKRTRDYPSPKPTLHRFFSHKPPFFFFNYRIIIIEESDSDSEISNIFSLAVLKDYKPNENWKTPVRATVRSLRRLGKSNSQIREVTGLTRSTIQHIHTSAR
jgi:hypothetical protein